MGSFANTLFVILLGWIQGAVSAVWSAFTNAKGESFLTWIGRHWLPVAGILCLAGLAADLCVYILRWKPFRVWKSFLTRNREEENPEETTETPAGTSRKSLQHPAAEKQPYTTPAAEHRTKPEPEPDFSRWEESEQAPAVYQRPEASEKPSIITNAGYIVPEDSPYRRPAVQTSGREVSEPEPDQPAGTARRDAREEKAPVAPRRRRRINVSDLFSDPEEEIREFDAPQHVIDSRTAYHEPVYPRGWKKDEDEEK